MKTQLSEFQHKVGQENDQMTKFYQMDFMLLYNGLTKALMDSITALSKYISILACTHLLVLVSETGTDS